MDSINLVTNLDEINDFEEDEKINLNTIEKLENKRINDSKILNYSRKDISEESDDFISLEDNDFDLNWEFNKVSFKGESCFICY